MLCRNDKLIVFFPKKILFPYVFTSYQKIRGASQSGEVPVNYKCYRCNKPGHWIKNCPLGPLVSDYCSPSFRLSLLLILIRFPNSQKRRWRSNALREFLARSSSGTRIRKTIQSFNRRKFRRRKSKSSRRTWSAAYVRICSPTRSWSPAVAAPFATSAFGQLYSNRKITNVPTARRRGPPRDRLSRIGFCETRWMPSGTKPATRKPWCRKVGFSSVTIFCLGCKLMFFFSFSCFKQANQTGRGPFKRIGRNDEFVYQYCVRNRNIQWRCWCWTTTCGKRRWRKTWRGWSATGKLWGCISTWRYWFPTSGW